MANVRKGDTWYIDTVYNSGTSSTWLDVTGKNAVVTDIFVSSTNTAAQLVLSDSGTTKLDIRIAADDTTQHFSGVNIRFAGEIRPTTLTNCVATLKIQERQS